MSSESRNADFDEPIYGSNDSIDQLLTETTKRNDKSSSKKSIKLRIFSADIRIRSETIQ